jgi:hypothetical protein
MVLVGSGRRESPQGRRIVRRSIRRGGAPDRNDIAKRRPIGDVVGSSGAGQGFLASKRLDHAPATVNEAWGATVCPTGFGRCGTVRPLAKIHMHFGRLRRVPRVESVLRSRRSLRALRDRGIRCPEAPEWRGLKGRNRTGLPNESLRRKQPGRLPGWPPMARAHVYKVGKENQRERRALSNREPTSRVAIGPASDGSRSR